MTSVDKLLAAIAALIAGFAAKYGFDLEVHGPVMDFLTAALTAAVVYLFPNKGAS